VVSSVRGFSLLFFFVLIAFANLFLILQLNTVDIEDQGIEYEYVKESVGNRFLDALIQMYLFSLGEFSAIDGFAGGNDTNLAWLAFLISTFVLLLLFMNMVIAIMSEKFSEVGANKELYKF
jgi:hypothetical protein